MDAKRTITVRGVIMDGDKLFLLRLYDNGQPASYLALPGGKLESFEDITDCLSREIIEELGVKPDVGELLFVQQFAVDGREFMDFIFRINNSADFRQIDLTKTSHGQREIAEYGWFDPKTAPVLPEFLKQITSDTQGIKFYNYIK
jgi:ADP-ribose pyrophosphatase YjhB (NUDIX family)